MRGGIPLKSTFVVFIIHCGEQTCICVSFDMALHLILVPRSSASATTLQASNGYFIAIASTGAQLRVPGASDYCVSKHALNRLIEFVALGELGPRFRICHSRRL